MFKLKQLSPIGLKEFNYPVKTCLICRGLLNDACYQCTSKLQTDCNVINIDNSFYHYHCYNFIEKVKKNETNASKETAIINNLELESDNNSENSDEINLL
uniref:Uncharacterized protein n=1 Tax=viral metagenome TaxID=1070528 RepID=A0A6C0LRA5_9ZZZZ